MDKIRVGVVFGVLDNVCVECILCIYEYGGDKLEDG